MFKPIFALCFAAVSVCPAFDSIGGQNLDSITHAGAGETIKISSADAESFARYFEISVSSNNAQITSSLFAEDSVFSKLFKNLPVSDEFKSEYVKQNPISKMMLSKVVDLSDKRNLFKFVAVVNRDNELTPVFRVYTNSGLDYCYLELVRGADGDVKVADIYLLSEGQSVIAYLNNSLRPIVSLVAPRFSDKDGISFDTAETAFISNFKGRDYRKALAQYQRLSKSSSESENLLLIAIKCASAVSESKYNELSVKFRGLYPDSISINLLDIERKMLSGDWDAALACVDRLGKNVGNDPFLDLYRGNAFYAKRQYGRATSCFMNVVESEPAIAAPYYSLLMVLLEQEQYAKVNVYLKRLYQFSGVLIDPAKDDMFRDYCSTDYYNMWRSTYAKVDPK